MNRPRTVAAFTPEQYQRAHVLLAGHVATMMGRKLEEGDWSYIYCLSKGIPNRGWSNLQIDVLSNGLGVEHKMLGRSSDTDLRSLCGTRLMHPSLTRSIRVSEGDADDVMRDVLAQYAALVEARRQKVAESSETGTADLRTGWLLWQRSLRDFLYFEEAVIVPDPNDYTAVWHGSSPGRGPRKPSRSLWIYEKETGQKRYSVTTSAGAKIQPYFDVPPPDDPNLYSFRVQGEELGEDRVRVWITRGTERELRRWLSNDLTPEAIHQLIEKAVDVPAAVAEAAALAQGEAQPLILTSRAYALLKKAFEGVSDEHRMRLMLQSVELAG